MHTTLAKPGGKAPILDIKFPALAGLGAALNRQADLPRAFPQQAPQQLPGWRIGAAAPQDDPMAVRAHLWDKGWNKWGK